MLYHLFTYLDQLWDLPGAGLFQFISLRAALSLMTSLVIGILFGKRIIEWLQTIVYGLHNFASQKPKQKVLFIQAAPRK